MVVVKIKAREGELPALFKLMSSYNIPCLVSYKEDDLFSEGNLFLYLECINSEGITGEEKQRIISESFTIKKIYQC